VHRFGQETLKAAGAIERCKSETIGTASAWARFQPRLQESLMERIVAVGLLTRRELELLGPTFDRIWPVEDAPNFNELLRAIDEADRKLEERSGRKR
jgi:hypothetical protein